MPASSPCRHGGPRGGARARSHATREETAGAARRGRRRREEDRAEQAAGATPRGRRPRERATARGGLVGGGGGVAAWEVEGKGGGAWLPGRPRRRRGNGGGGWLSAWGEGGGERAWRREKSAWGNHPGRNARTRGVRVPPWSERCRGRKSLPSAFNTLPCPNSLPCA